MLRRVQLVLSGSLLGVAALAAASIAAQPELGVISERPGGVVLHVDPGGPAWRAGIRPGQSVAALEGVESSTGWHLVTSADGVTRELFRSSAIDTHRGHLGWAVVALVTSVLTAYVAYASAPISAIALPLTFAFASYPLLFAGSVAASLIAGIATFAGGALAPIAFVSTRSINKARQRLLRAVAVIGLALAAAWAASILILPTLFDLLDLLRWPAALSYAAVGAWFVIDRDWLRGLVVGRVGQLFFVDFAYATFVAGLFVAILLLIHGPLIVAVTASCALLIAYPIWRRTIVAWVHQMMTAGAAREARMRAGEEERRRVAREIHDGPLQELTFAIQELEDIEDLVDDAPETRALRDRVRALADRSRGTASSLRGVTSELYPAVLLDLGLAAAIHDLASMIKRPDGVEIDVEVTEVTGVGRAPAEVEYTAYRIAREALTNALRHSGAGRIDVVASVESAVIMVAVTDHGGGYDDDDIVAARADGHFGLDSMRDRARLVGGTLEMRVGPDGVAVTFRWAARQ